MMVVGVLTPSHDIYAQKKLRKQGVGDQKNDFSLENKKGIKFLTAREAGWIYSCSSSSSSPPTHQPLHHLLIAPGDYKVSAVVMVMNVFRSICGGQLKVQTRRTLV